ncbi:MAG: hypothetical protein MI975_10925 [Cytophagales bacterium]|nr:hypothetical protein [Cytophagales bacterium]
MSPFHFYGYGGKRKDHAEPHVSNSRCSKKLFSPKMNGHLPVRGRNAKGFGPAVAGNQQIGIPNPKVANGSKSSRHIDIRHSEK